MGRPERWLRKRKNTFLLFNLVFWEIGVPWLLRVFPQMLRVEECHPWLWRRGAGGEARLPLKASLFLKLFLWENYFLKTYPGITNPLYMLLPLLVFSFSALAGSSEAENIILFFAFNIREPGECLCLFWWWAPRHTDPPALSMWGEGGRDAETGGERGRRGNQLEGAWYSPPCSPQTQVNW